MTSTTKISALLGAAMLAASSTLGAQAVDARWQPWIGCWTPVAGEPSPLRLLGASPRVCVIPAQGTSAVEVVTIAAGKVVDRTRIEADMQSHPVTRDGCTGTETARWSEMGTRLYLASAVTCAGGVSRHGSGVLSMTERYEWLDVRGMTSGKTASVSVGRLTAAEVDGGSVPADVMASIPPRTTTTNTSVLAASAALRLADIADVATSADSGVTAAWLMERTRGLKLSITGKQLTALADAGVSPAVIDYVVALAHPAVFGFAGSGGAGVAAGNQTLTGQANMYDRGIYPYGGMGYYGYSGYNSCYDYNPFSMLYGYGYGCSGYGYNGRYGMYSPYAGSYYNGYYPPVIIIRSDETGANMPQHGRVVKGQGYTNGGGTTGSTARPSQGLTSGSSSGSSSSGSSGSASSGGSSGSGDTGGGGRTAVKKP